MIFRKMMQEEDVKYFINKLPELSIDPPTAHLVMLAIRSKKAKSLMDVKIKDLLIERKIIKPIPDWRDRYFNLIYNYSILQKEGKYFFRGMQVPSGARAIYATLSPRDTMKAVEDIMRQNIGYLYQRDDGALLQLGKETSRFFGAMHKHKNRSTNFITFDLDVLDKELMLEIRNEVSTFPIWMITETSGGYHIILDLKYPTDARDFYGVSDKFERNVIQRIMEKYSKKGLEFQRDSQEPVPGTIYHRNDDPNFMVKILE